jgi:hypothetical protein
MTTASPSISAEPTLSVAALFDDAGELLGPVEARAGIGARRCRRRYCDQQR